MLRKLLVISIALVALVMISVIASAVRIEAEPPEKTVENTESLEVSPEFALSLLLAPESNDNSCLVPVQTALMCDSVEDCYKQLPNCPRKWVKCDKSQKKPGGTKGKCKCSNSGAY